jgi:hypothetical protein
MSLADKDLALVLLVLLDQLHAFHTWPLFLLAQELDRLSRRIEAPDAAADSPDQRFWFVAYLLLDHHADAKRASEREHQRESARGSRRLG